MVSFLMEYLTMNFFTKPGKQKLLKQENITPCTKNTKNIPKSHSWRDEEKKIFQTINVLTVSRQHILT